jgi:hypothetical protein
MKMRKNSSAFEVDDDDDEVLALTGGAHKETRQQVCGASIQQQQTSVGFVREQRRGRLSRVRRDRSELHLSTDIY